ncbi:PepSY domain-containing protein [Azohydromonas aeria]|uniref:PepSY domain-containing protein n=1 Tax=Azohydromonas aeria TaxID=2590212 RepID=UPI0012FA8A90|nr:PepSY domain-containing protein [Azohydromonas aeria]
MNVFHRFRATLAAALATAALVAVAQPASAPAQAPAPAAATPAAAMSFQQVIERLASLGYHDIREIERKGDKLYEVEARDDKGRRVEMDVDARSGEILAQDVKGRR